jgi:hypothetical protein
MSFKPKTGNYWLNKSVLIFNSFEGTEEKLDDNARVKKAIKLASIFVARIFSRYLNC